LAKEEDSRFKASYGFDPFNTVPELPKTFEDGSINSSEDGSSKLGDNAAVFEDPFKPSDDN